MTHDLPNLQDLAHEGRPNASNGLRPVLGEGGLQHDAGAFVSSAQDGTGSDGGGAEGVVREGWHDGAYVFQSNGGWKARRLLLNGVLVLGVGPTAEAALRALEANWGEKA